MIRKSVRGSRFEKFIKVKLLGSHCTPHKSFRKLSGGHFGTRIFVLAQCLRCHKTKFWVKISGDHVSYAVIKHIGIWVDKCVSNIKILFIAESRFKIMNDSVRGGHFLFPGASHITTGFLISLVKTMLIFLKGTC